MKSGCKKVLKQNEKGFTLIEVMAGMMIVAFAIIGLVQAFIYGNIYVDRFGLKRQAMVVLNSKMETVLAYKRATGSLDNPQAILYTDEEINIGSQAGIRSVFESVISPASFEENLKFWDVHLKLSYGNQIFTDSASLSSRFYQEGRH